MAEVWLARKPVGKTGSKYVALKLIAEHYVGDERYTRMFRAEVELAAVLSHANIAQVFDEGEEDGRSYLVMEWVDGLNLLKLGEKLAWLGDEPRRARVSSYIIGQLLHALHYAHSIRSADGHPLGVVHRDVSPQNVLVSNNGEVKLTDFGVAHHNFEESSGVHVKGKVRYMSPEQLSGKTRLPTVDLYAVGALLHELLDGKRFRGVFEDGQDLFSVVLSGYVPPLSRPATPELDRLRLGLLAPDPAQRIQSAAQALALLRCFSGYGDAREELASLCGSLTGVVHPRTGPGQSTKVAVAEQATTRWGGREAPRLPPPPPIVSRRSSSPPSGSTTAVKGNRPVRVMSTAMITGQTEWVRPRVALVSGPGPAPTPAGHGPSDPSGRPRTQRLAPSSGLPVEPAVTEVIGPSMIMEMRSGSATDQDILHPAVAGDGTDTQHDGRARTPSARGSAHRDPRRSVYPAVGLLSVLVAAISVSVTWLAFAPEEGTASEATARVMEGPRLAWPLAPTRAAGGEEVPEPGGESTQTQAETGAVKTAVALVEDAEDQPEPVERAKAGRRSSTAARAVPPPVRSAAVKVVGSSGLDEADVRLSKASKQTFSVDGGKHSIKAGWKSIEWRKSPSEPWQRGTKWHFKPGRLSIIHLGKQGPRVRFE
jgi:serine/threonine protein kinase